MNPTRAGRLQKAGLPTWQGFVVEHGHRVPVTWLAHVLGKSPEDILRVRRSGACVRRVASRTFAELFSLWHGRSPGDEDWPRPGKRAGGGYEWHPPELALLATQVGRYSAAEIARVLTVRLRALTGDRKAVRTRTAVQGRIHLIGLQSTDVLGGITVADAGKEVQSRQIVYQAIRKGELCTYRAGRLLVIDRADWQTWRSRRLPPPEGYVQLATLKPLLSAGSDKLAEYAANGYIETAIRCFPMKGGVSSSARGTWYIAQEVADRLIADRLAGRRMPWFGKPMLSNLKSTYRLFHQRQHPRTCDDCRRIWGPAGAPSSFEEFMQRYPALDHGAKRHLTRPWVPGLTIPETARHCASSAAIVRRAIANGMIAASLHQGRHYVSKTDATRWRARRCPAGEGSKSWISLATARKLYGFSTRELKEFVAARRLRSMQPAAGPGRGQVYVLRHQCAQIRERQGFTLDEAAKRAGVSTARMHMLLTGANWRRVDDHVPLETLRTVLKRLKSSAGVTVAQAASNLGVQESTVRAHIEAGTIRVQMAKWGSGEPLITPPMLARLRGALASGELPVRFDRESWCSLSEATTLAGVSTGTLGKWASAGEINRIHRKGRWLYERASVMNRARSYWSTCRLKRAVLPSWLCAAIDKAA